MTRKQAPKQQQPAAAGFPDPYAHLRDVGNGNPKPERVHLDRAPRDARIVSDDDDDDNS